VLKANTRTGLLYCRKPAVSTRRAFLCSTVFLV
jgi:hypothetical protein